VEAVLDDLAPKDRTVLLAEVGVGERVNQPTTKMARLRARKRLVAAMDRVAAAFGGIQIGWRRAGLWLQTVRPSGDPLLPVMVGVATVVTAATLATPPAPSIRQAHRTHRLVHAQEASARRPNQHRPGRAQATEKPDQQAVQIEAAAPVETSNEPTPRPSPTKKEIVHAGDAEASTKEGQGYKGVEVCTGDSTSDESDDHSHSVTIFDGTQEGDHPESCS
jgi:hypothetical protein